MERLSWKHCTRHRKLPIEQPPALVIVGIEGHPLASVNDTLKGTDIPLQSQVRDTVVDMAVAISVAEPAHAGTHTPFNSDIKVVNTWLQEKESIFLVGSEEVQHNVTKC
jgi:hypothetical protein